MDLIKDAENKLKEYRLLEKSLDNMSKEIARLKWSGAPKLTGAMQINVSGIITSQNVSDALNIACAIAYCKETRIMNKREIQRIDANLNYISREPGKDDYGQLLRLWYIGKREDDPETGKYDYRKIPVEEICQMLGYSSDSRHYFYERKKDALRKFAKAYWGTRVS